MVKKILLLINPMAGRQRIINELVSVVDEFTKAGYETVIYTTQGSDGTSRILREAEGRFDTVICSGGDGTFNEILGDTMTWKNRPNLGYIPCGTTNDFAMGLGIPTDIMDAVKNIIEGKPHTLDTGKFGDHYFSYVASFGAFTETSYSTPQSFKNAFGHAAYMFSALKELPNMIPIKVHLEVNDRVYDDKFSFGAVTNAHSVGGVVRLDPEYVKFNDGLFEVMLVRPPQTLLDLSIILNSVSTMKYDPRLFVYTQASELDFATEKELNWSIDGEKVSGGTSVHISCVHNGLSLITRDTPAML